MPNHNRRSRSRSRNRDSRSRSRHTRRRHESPRNEFRLQMQLILDRLSSLEDQRRPPSPRPCLSVVGESSPLPVQNQVADTVHREGASTPPLTERPRQRAVGEATAGQQRRASVTQSSPRPHSASAVTDRDATATDRIIDAIRSINTTVRPNQFYYISNFDPSVNDIDVWCEEVDRAKSINGWNDNECLSRIGHCLKGDARTWLNEWVTSDRSWSSSNADKFGFFYQSEEMFISVH